MGICESMDRSKAESLIASEVVLDSFPYNQLHTGVLDGIGMRIILLYQRCAESDAFILGRQKAGNWLRTSRST